MAVSVFDVSQTETMFFWGGKQDHKETSPPPVTVTGSFDPTALERGATALREIDRSPNASKAFEAIRHQEVTKQKASDRDTAKHIAEQSKALAEKARVEGEEKRRCHAHREEEERITARYKAQLETEANLKRLEDNRNAAAELMEIQRLQNEKQEQARLRTEAETIRLRAAAATEEKRLAMEADVARIAATGRAEALAERENADLRLRQLKERMKGQKDTVLAAVGATATAMGAGVSGLIDDKRRLAALVAMTTAAAAGVYGTRAAASVATTLLEARLGRPPLVRETSRRAWIGPHPFHALRRRAFTRALPLALTEEVVLPPDLSQRLQWGISALRTSRQCGASLRHLLLSGEPGTGKTLFARKLARESRMDYAIITGGDITPLGRRGAHELRRVFNWADKSRKGVILFIDEAEAFLGRGRSRGDMSEDLRSALASFLFSCGTESRNLAVVLATNAPEALDPAVLDRIDEHVEFPVPAVDERRRMLDMFARIHLHPPPRSECPNGTTPHIACS
eukprot:Polyplicarium_translucidae@DN2700_c0_g1_i5.p1